MPFLLCADFSLFPDNHVLGPSFTLAAMHFTDPPGGAITSFVNGTDGTLALQFSDAGVEVDLPPLTQRTYVSMRVGAFAGSFDITAVDIGGNVVANRVITLLNIFQTVNFGQPDIARLVFKGGSNEGMIASICTIVS
jgi:hypothetical protein